MYTLTHKKRQACERAATITVFLNSKSLHLIFTTMQVFSQVFACVMTDHSKAVLLLALF